MAQLIEEEGSRPAGAWEAATVPQAARSRRRRAGRRWGPWLAIGFIALLTLIGLLAPFLAPYDPIKQDLSNPIGGPSLHNLLGTDEFGRDVLSRLIWGTRPALLGTLVAVATACVIGLPWGLVSGYAGGLAEDRKSTRLNSSH